MNSEVISLFPTPVFKSQYHSSIEDIVQYCTTVDYRDGIGCIQSSNTKVLDSPELYNLKQFVENKLAEYTLKVLGSYQEIDITQSWVNRSPTGGCHKPHMHPNSLISGIFYIQLDEEMPQVRFHKKVPPSIVLHSHTTTEYIADFFSINAKSGTLLLFPSDLNHSVPENKSERDRISLAFNTFPKGAFGNCDRLTYCDPNS
jgi:uncharacterized protein (TIGR02466 family)